MALRITEACVNCALCEPLCPMHAIGEGEDYFVIHPGLCNECVGFNDEPLCALVCPVDCCIPEPAHLPGKEELLRGEDRYFPR